ncbi:hypothetical protein [Paraburkholderia antibiotica]|uniref:hypothetical protein n=1 Tax=Paraburkholderia antibiotica TaxID=2728839 RepID=UPI001E32D6C1|nr:hypothetical protein [Paraburkholderia antibiotica]
MIREADPHAASATDATRDSHTPHHPRTSHASRSTSRPRGAPAAMSDWPPAWLAYAAACQSAQIAARDYAEQSFANWSRSIGFAAQREADWFDAVNRSFAAWYAWWASWQAAFGIQPGIAPGLASFASIPGAWWWASQNALPFAGLV